MARVKGGTIHHARRKKVLKQAKGYFGSKHRLYKTANEQVMHSLKYAYRDRKQKKRDFRKLWITRINAACRMNDISYSKFMNGLSKANVDINRKMLSEIAIENPKGFTELVKISKAALEGKTYESTRAAKKEEVKEKINHQKAVVKEKVAEKKEKIENKKAAVKEKVAEKKAEIKKAVKKDYSELTVTELKKLAKDQNVEGYSTMKKADLLKALK